MRYLASSVPSGGVLNLVSSIFRRSQTGTLELETEQGQKKLYFVDGQLYLRRSVIPLAARISAHLESHEGEDLAEPDVGLRDLLRLTAEHLAKWKVTTYRFFEGFQVDAEELTGPLPTGFLVMQGVGSEDDEESERLKMMGGADTLLETKISQNPDVIDSLKPAEAALLGHLQRPTRIGDLLGGSKAQSSQTVRALARLWVLELVTESGFAHKPATSTKLPASRRSQKSEHSRARSREVESEVGQPAPEEVLEPARPPEGSRLPAPDERAETTQSVAQTSIEQEPVPHLPGEADSVREANSTYSVSELENVTAPDSLAVKPRDRQDEPPAEHESATLPVSGALGVPEESRREDADLRIWQHFGLRADPFTLTPDPRFLYQSESHGEALAGIKLSLLEKRGLCVMTGEVGTGKTTLLYSMLSSLGVEFETAYVHNPALPFDQLLEHILDDFGITVPQSHRRVELLERLNQFLIRCAGDQKIVALIIDEAQNLSDATFEALRLLLNFETFDSKLLQIILVGQPELGERLNSTTLRQIKDRIAIRCQLEPLSQSEAREYIGHRIKAAGGSPDSFGRRAASLAIKKARCIPRRINVICHNAMLYAYANGQRTVTKSQVAEAVRDLKG